MGQEIRVSECVNMKINDLSFDTNRHIDKEKNW